MTLIIDFGPIKHLRHAGIRPSDATWNAIQTLGSAAIPPLLELALDTRLLREPEPVAYAPLHALRLLAKLPAGAEAERLLAAPIAEDQRTSDATYLWNSEVAQVAGSWGGAALGGIRATVDNAGAAQGIRARALSALAFAAEADPGIRAEVVAELRHHLASEADPKVLGEIVFGLASLHVVDAYGEIMAAYRRGAVDKTIITAADARQLLLGSTKVDKLKCVHHTLAELYAEHGPFSPEQRRALEEEYRTRRG